MKAVAQRIFREAFRKNGYIRVDRRVKTDETFMPRVVKIANAVKIRLSKRNAEAEYYYPSPQNVKATFCWDGNSIACGNRDITDIVHDIAHHQCAAPSRRHLPEWGLGTSPDGTKKAALVIDGNTAQREEECASLLGILWERQIGSNWIGTIDMHSWIGEGPKDCITRIAKTLRKLHKLKLVDKNGNPLPNLRPARTNV